MRNFGAIFLIEVLRSLENALSTRLMCYGVVLNPGQPESFFKFTYVYFIMKIMAMENPNLQGGFANLFYCNQGHTALGSIVD